VRAIIRYGLIGLGLAMSVTPAAAKDALADFYSGKTITVLNAFGQGGQYGMLARLVATLLPRHLPGHPNGVPQFMPGAAGLLQTNYLYNVAAKDGTVIGLMYDNIPTTQVLEAKENVKFDARKFGVLGSLNKGEAGLVGVLKRTGIASVEDAKHKTSVFGATGTSGGQYQVPNIMNKLFGTKFKLIPGFKTTAMIYLAMDRNEVDGIYGAYEVIAEVRPEWVAEKRMNWLAQVYDHRATDFPNVPLLQELAQNDRDRAALKFLALARTPGKIFVAPPGVPPERLAALRTAFESMVRDPAFKADLAKGTQDLDPRSWQDAARVIAETVDTPDDLATYLRSLLKAE
jgi:tripartite-type tricarboxylate transporter receptor subunit TctC